MRFAILRFVTMTKLNSEVFLLFAHCRKGQTLKSSFFYFQSSLFFLSLAAAGAHHAFAADATRDVSVQSIVDVWKHRQHSLPATKIRWERNANDFNRFSMFQTDHFPLEDQPESTRCSELRITEDSWMLAEQRWNYRLRDEFSAFDKNTSSSLLTLEQKKNSHLDIISHPEYMHHPPIQLTQLCKHGSRIDYFSSTGNMLPIARTAKHDNLATIRHYLEYLSVLPCLIHFRPLASGGMGVNPANCHVSKDLSNVNGHKSLLLTEVIELENQSVSRLFWVDPKRDFVVLRYIVRIGHETREQFDIEYTQNDGKMWSPSQWTLTLDAKGTPSLVKNHPGNIRLFQFYSCSVVDCDMESNVNENDLELRLPVKTILFDENTKERYLVTDNGEKKQISVTDLLKLTMSDSRSSWSEILNSQAALLGTVAVIIVIGLVARRRRQRVHLSNVGADGQ